MYVSGKIELWDEMGNDLIDMKPIFLHSQHKIVFYHLKEQRAKSFKSKKFLLFSVSDNDILGRRAAHKSSWADIATCT